MSEKLKPCPFCGGKGVIKDLGEHRFHIHCDSCPCQIGDTWSDKERLEYLIDAWNSRPDEPDYTEFNKYVREKHKMTELNR